MFYSTKIDLNFDRIDSIKRFCKVIQNLYVNVESFDVSINCVNFSHIETFLYDKVDLIGFIESMINHTLIKDDYIDIGFYNKQDKELFDKNYIFQIECDFLNITHAQLVSY